MNNEVLNLINKAIEEEFLHNEEREIEDTKYIEDYRNLGEKKDNILKELSLEVTENKDRLIQELDDINMNMVHFITRYYFKKGVISGLTSLKYLGDTRTEISFMREKTI